MTKSEWLPRTLLGYCGSGSPEFFEGDCNVDSRGAFRLPGASYTSWDTLKATCQRSCEQCSRCRAVSFSLRWKDCSWYHSCDHLAITNQTDDEAPCHDGGLTTLLSKTSTGGHACPTAGTPRRLVSAAPRLTLAQPFVFIHMEKTGGTTIRLLAANELLGHNSMFYTSHNTRGATYSRTIIMCHGMPCTDVQLAQTNLLNRTACALAFVGHFAPLPLFNTLVRIDRGEFGPVCCQRWPGLSPPQSRVRRLSAAMANALAWKAFEHALTATVLREPLSRAVSHFYYFAYGEGNETSLHAFDDGNRSIEFGTGDGSAAKVGRTNLSFGEYASAFGVHRTMERSDGHRQLRLLSAVWDVGSPRLSQCNPHYTSEQVRAAGKLALAEDEASRAKKVLSTFDVVGTIEHLDVLLKKLAQVMPRIRNDTQLHAGRSAALNAEDDANNSSSRSAKQLKVNQRYVKRDAAWHEQLHARLVQANRTQIHPRDREVLLAELEPDMELYMHAKARSGPNSSDAFKFSNNVPWSANDLWSNLDIADQAPPKTASSAALRRVTRGPRNRVPAIETVEAADPAARATSSGNISWTTPSAFHGPALHGPAAARAADRAPAARAAADRAAADRAREGQQYVKFRAGLGLSVKWATLKFG